MRFRLQLLLQLIGAFYKFERSCIAFIMIKLGPTDSFVHLKSSSFSYKKIFDMKSINFAALETKILEKFQVLL